MQPPLAAWESFYVIVGSSGAALTGLQFVVMALVAESRKQSNTGEIEAFGTPTVVHFCAALLVSATLSAPWRYLPSVGLALGLCGAAGVAYALMVVWRARRQTGYRPVLEDWLWHAVFPFLAYATILASSVALASEADSALFGVGAATLGLLFIGIHNSWDTVTFIAVASSQASSRGGGKH